MGLWDRLRGRGPGGFRERRAEALERAGNLSAAIETYLDAELPEEAARLQIARADAEPRPAERIVLFRAAARMAPGTAGAKRAEARAARMRWELVKGKGAVMQGEVLGAAEELMQAEEYRLASEAFAEAGDKEREVAALVQAGAMSEVEEKLEREVREAREGNEVALAVRRARDLDLSGDRREALALIDPFANDPTARDLRLRILQRLARGPLVRARVNGEERDLALSTTVTVGRGDATLMVPSPQLSRLHIEVFRDPTGAPSVRDLNTKNGTILGGARVGGDLPIGAGLTLKLGGEVACVITREGEHVTIEVGSHHVLASLGPLTTPFGAVELLEGAAGPAVVFRRAEVEVFLNTLAIGPEVQLAEGDELKGVRDGEPFLVVLGRSAGE